MRKALLALAAFALFAAGCSDSASTSTTVAVTATGVSSSSTSQGTTGAPGSSAPSSSTTPPTTPAPVTTTTSTTSTTTAPPVPVSAEALLIANDDGVFRFGDDGSVTPLVTGSVVLAVDDTQGGLLFQRSRGRFSTGESSIVWWVRPASGIAESLLVPSQPDHVLSLHDVVDFEGSRAVLYTRGEGTDPDAVADTLRTYDLASLSVEEIGGTGGWESGSDPISIGGGIIAMTWYAEALNGFAFWDLAGRDVPVAANPYGADEFCFDRDCEWSVEIAPDGAALAYFQQLTDDAGLLVDTDLVVVETDTGVELARVHVRGEQGEWLLHSIDLFGTTAVVNRERLDRTGYLEPWVIEFDGAAPTIFEVPLAGLARIQRAPLTIAAPVLVP